MSKYIRLCVGLQDKGILVPEDYNLSTFLQKYPNDDLYTSLYYYNEDHKDRFQELGSIAGITDTTTDRLLWDFDSEENFEQVRADTLELIDRLRDYDIEPEDLNVYFSGNKGTHVSVYLDKDITPHEFKYITKTLAEGLDTYDSTVSNPSRVIRIPFSKHQKTGLFKTKLSPKQLQNLSIEYIRKHAESRPKHDFEFYCVSVPNIVVPEASEKPQNTSDDVQTEELNLDYSSKPKWLSHWKYALLHGYFPNGCRNSALMILAATYRGQGLPETVTYHAVKGAAELQAERFDAEKYPKEDIYRNIIKQVYSPTWNNGTYAEDNFPEALKKYLEKLGVPRQAETNLKEQQIELISEGFDDFAKYAENINEFTMKFGIPELDEKLKCRKGHLIGFLAPAGCGKTSLGIKILNNMSKEGIHSYFCSYDMYRHNVYQKLIQMHSGLSEDILFESFINKDQEKINQYRKLLEKNYSNVSFCFKVGQSIEDLKTSIKLQEEKIGKTIELVVVDYLELVLTKASDPTAASAEAIQGLREIANEGKVVICLLQPNKMNSKPNEPILNYTAAKGSSSIGQAATAIITAHRPGLSSETPENDKYFSINCVKNRNGPLFALDFSWDGRTQQIGPLSDIEREELKELRQAQRDNNDDDF
jgi:replicative DNA helicase